MKGASPAKDPQSLVFDAPKLSLIQKIKVRLGVTVFLGYYKKQGWTGYNPFYARYCKKHGFYADYPQGYEEVFICPRCWEESKK